MPCDLLNLCADACELPLDDEHLVEVLGAGEQLEEARFLRAQGALTRLEVDDVAGHILAAL